MGAKKKPTTPAEATADERLSQGRSREEARFTAAPPMAGLPPAYASTLEEIKRHLQQSRLRTVLAANAAMVLAYWDIGQVILTRQQSEGWGTKVIDRLSADLREAFPDMQGLSPRNLLSMKLFAQAFSAGAIAKQPVSQLPWGHIVRLLQMVKDPAARAVYNSRNHRPWMEP